ncbi:DUF6090 family protein [Aestuariibaculum sp. M13]|uniref:DUF6090 family protein n=1 Tax=Aestuariibaculum sp. M13 TaxID=2967132 RepID=UPI002159F8C6|nr:DUF6090 family protein [Aestuariibaculum sp. M13]MCR8667691.1 DUF6090 family protein [Aestuariibaculum sp. M13]
MIKFFRNIRKRLINEGKTTNYLKYALGEIVLVVFGILIALQMNNWNQNRIENLRTRDLLQNMKNDLRSDINFLIAYVEGNEKQVKYSVEILNDSLNEAIDADSLYKKLPLWATTLEINSQSFDKIKNVGLTNLLGLKELDSTITEYYVKSTHMTQGFTNWEQEQTQNDNDFWLSASKMEFPNSFSSENNVAYKQTEAERKQELMRIINSIEGRKRIRLAMNRKQALTKILLKRKDKAEYLLSLIEESL